MSCDQVKKNTPDKYLNQTGVVKERYASDQVEVTKQLKASLIKREDFFDNSAYSDSTQLLIDTILYSPDLNKLAVFLIIKNPEDKHLLPNKKYEWYYDGTCYLGTRQKDTISLSWIGPSFTNSNDQKDLSEIIRTSYFKEYASKDTGGKNTQKYNLNDVRFWNSPIWKEIQNKKIRRLEFEEAKRKHPENIYDKQVQ